MKYQTIKEVLGKLMMAEITVDEADESIIRFIGSECDTCENRFMGERKKRFKSAAEK
jgi:hypothetical protein